MGKNARRRREAVERLKAERDAARPHRDVTALTSTGDKRTFDEWIDEEVARAEPCSECGAPMVLDPFLDGEEFDTFDGVRGESAYLVCSKVLELQEAADDDPDRSDLHPESRGEREIERTLAQWT